MSETINESEVAEEIVTTVVFEGQCPTISGQSTLTWQLGRREDAIWLRITANTGGGMFSDDWVDGRAIDPLVDGAKELTSRSFQSLYPGRSINSGGFAFAVLKDLGLVQARSDNSRKHEHVKDTTFEALATARMSSDSDTPKKPNRRKPKEA